MDEIIRKWRKSHHRCRNCKYLRQKSVVDYKCEVKGHTMCEWDVFRNDGLFPCGMFCMSYRSKESEENNG